MRVVSRYSANPGSALPSSTLRYEESAPSIASQPTACRERATGKSRHSGTPGRRTAHTLPDTPHRKDGFRAAGSCPRPVPLVNGTERRFRPPEIARRKRHALPAAGDKPAGGKGFGKESLHRFGLFAGPYAPEVRRRQVFISAPAPRRPYGRTSRPSRPASAATSRPVFPHP